MFRDPQPARLLLAHNLEFIRTAVVFLLCNAVLSLLVTPPIRRPLDTRFPSRKMHEATVKTRQR